MLGYADGSRWLHGTFLALSWRGLSRWPLRPCLFHFNFFFRFSSCLSGLLTFSINLLVVCGLWARLVSIPFCRWLRTLLGGQETSVTERDGSEVPCVDELYIALKQFYAPCLFWNDAVWGAMNHSYVLPERRLKLLTKVLLFPSISYVYDADLDNADKCSLSDIRRFVEIEVLFPLSP